MARTQQEELILQAHIIGVEPGRTKITAAGKLKGPCGLLGQGFWADKTSERFKAGKPDLRIARRDLGQLDVELKYCSLTISLDGEVECGFTKLQWLKMGEMNKHGIPTIGLVYVANVARPHFVVTTLLRERLLSSPYCVTRLPHPAVVDGVSLFATAKRYLHDRYPS